MGVRESQRRAWREAVSRAAEAMRRGRRKGRNITSVLYTDYLRHKKALSAPKPWTRQAAADLGWRIFTTACGDDPAPCSACRRWSRAGRAKRRAIRDGQIGMLRNLAARAMRSLQGCRKRRAAQRRRR